MSGCVCTHAVPMRHLSPRVCPERVAQGDELHEREAVALHHLPSCLCFFWAVSLTASAAAPLQWVPAETGGEPEKAWRNEVRLVESDPFPES